jgi:hypothetical protein
VWLLHFGFLELSMEQAHQFWKFQYELALFEARLKRLRQFIRRRKTSSRTITGLKGKVASLGEAVLHLYIKECTGGVYHKETSILLEAAAEAYNLEEKTSFAQDAVSHRYIRFRKKHRTELEEIERDIAELWSERDKGIRVDLIPFLIARRKARFQLLARKYRERSGSAQELSVLENVVEHINRLAPKARTSRRRARADPG